MYKKPILFYKQRLLLFITQYIAKKERRRELLDCQSIFVVEYLTLHRIEAEYRSLCLKFDFFLLLSHI